jgi:prepilin-type processing-associated H-X9-DG protein
MNMPPPPNVYQQPQFQQPKSDINKYIWLGVGGCLCIVLMGVGLIAAFMMPQLNRGREGLALGGCLQNMRALGMSLSMYEQNNNDMLPPADHWMDGISSTLSLSSLPTSSKQLDSYGLLRCPEIAQLQDRTKFGYAFLDGLNSGESSIADRNLTPVIFDSTLLDWNAHGPLSTQPIPPRHSQNHFLFADGHVTSESSSVSFGSTN